MRYADGPTVEVEVWINAAVERVWELVTDINMSSQFSSEQQGCEWTNGATRPTLGATFAGTNTHQAIGEWTSVSTITELDSMRSVGWTVGDVHNPSATWRFYLEAHGQRTRLRQRAQLGPGPSGLTPAILARPDKEERIVERRLQEHKANMTATVHGIKAFAEGEE